MLFRRFVVSALLRAAQNQTVQKKISEAAVKAMNRARPSLLRASRKAGELKWKATKKILDDK
ncbi:hypothetical protein N8500_03900 [Candidatus Puniceispirillum sp.]|nr:hypothetical protein [Candidatus Puniceispirillum sp.]